MLEKMAQDSQYKIGYMEKYVLGLVMGLWRSLVLERKRAEAISEAAGWGRFSDIMTRAEFWAGEWLSQD